MKLLLYCALAALASLPLWPAPWRVGLALGWTSAMALELWLNHKRTALMRGGRRGNLLGVIALGFLAKLFVVGTGAVIGAYSGLFHLESFLLSFLAAMTVGETIGLTGLARPARPDAGTPTREDLR